MVDAVKAEPLDKQQAAPLGKIFDYSATFYVEILRASFV